MTDIFPLPMLPAMVSRALLCSVFLLFFSSAAVAQEGGVLGGALDDAPVDAANLLAEGEERIERACADHPTWDELPCIETMSEALKALRDADMSSVESREGRELCAARHRDDYPAWRDCERIHRFALERLAELPTEREEERRIRAICEGEHPVDARARVECELGYRELLERWDSWAPEGLSPELVEAVKAECRFRYPERPNFWEACADVQAEAKRELDAQGAGSELEQRVLAVCEEAYPRDFSEQRFCFQDNLTAMTDQESGEIDFAAEIRFDRAVSDCALTYPPGSMRAMCVNGRLKAPERGAERPLYDRIMWIALTAGPDARPSAPFELTLGGRPYLRNSPVGVSVSATVGALPLGRGLVPYLGLGYRYDRADSLPAERLPVTIAVPRHSLFGQAGFRFIPFAGRADAGFDPREAGSLRPLFRIAGFVEPELSFIRRKTEPGSSPRRVYGAIAPGLELGLGIPLPRVGRDRWTVDLSVDARFFVSPASSVLIGRYRSGEEHPAGEPLYFNQTGTWGSLGFRVGVSYLTDPARMFRGRLDRPKARRTAASTE